jgi:hypothetical protein
MSPGRHAAFDFAGFIVRRVSRIGCSRNLLLLVWWILGLSLFDGSVDSARHVWWFELDLQYWFPDLIVTKHADATR